MTRYTFHFAAAMALSLVFAVPGSAQEAQEETPARPSALHVAAQVQGFYDQSQGFEARFVQTYYNRVYQRYERSRGAMAFDKPGRMRFDYARHNGKVVVSDGRRLTMWEPGDDGGPGQYMSSPMGRASLPGAFSFLTGEGRLEESYTFRLLSPRTYRFEGYVLELTPRRPDPRYRRVLLYVDASPRRRGLVRAIRIDDHDGNRNKFEMHRMRFDRAIPASRFSFRPPRGARRIRG
ncbi:MAG: outer membrane lipoprotein carrier protein LolA [Deltaproteobacteria bacterium]|nr:outer membrane lipoprotein carrier protein LolA [Deltaproteobacteria bacterium]